MKIEEIEKKLEEAIKSGYVCPACGNLHLGDTEAIIRSLIAQVKEAEKTAENAVEVAEANIQAEIANGGTSCHWCIAKTRKQAFLEVADHLMKPQPSTTTFCCLSTLSKASEELRRKAGG